MQRMQHDWHDPSRPLIEFLDNAHIFMNFESRSLRALELIRSGADIHAIITEYNESCLHRAIPYSSIDVIQLLLEKGIDVNAQNNFGDTALHVTCYNYEVPVQKQVELVPMLLYHGADPWIRNNYNLTPLDRIFRDRFGVSRQNAGTWILVATIEHLCYHMFDHYTEFKISPYALLRTAELQEPAVFREIVATIEEVDMHHLEMISDMEMRCIFTMPLENLRFLVEKFDCVFMALFHSEYVNAHFDWMNDFRLENVYILLESHLQREFIEWLDKWKVRYDFLDSLFRNPAPLASREKIVYYLLSCGMVVYEEYIETIYKYCGYNDLLKLLRFLDVKTDSSYEMKRLIPRLVFQINGDIQKNIEDPRFWVKYLTHWCSKLDFEPVLPYYAVLNLKDLCSEVKVEGNENFFKKLLDQPRIPLLVEMARNVFRKYFVQRLGITSAKQFYMSLELLPISPHHRKIIALEIELY